MGLDDFDKPFIWRKKYEEKGIKIDEKELQAEYKKRVEENKIELQKIRERQKKREQEYQQKLNDVEFLQRQKEAKQHEHWEQQEDDFILKQHKHRSKIRIRDGRAKPIDLLAHYCDIFGANKTAINPSEDSRKKDTSYLQEEKIDLSDSSIELLNPCDWFNGLRESDLLALEPDIKIYMNADSSQNEQYWQDLLEITRNELSKLQSSKEQPSSTTDLNSAIVTDVMSLFDGKSIPQLNDMESEICDILNDDNPSIDTAFYKSTLSRLRAYRAKLRLTQNHKKNLKRQKDKILEISKSNPSSSSIVSFEKDPTSKQEFEAINLDKKPTIEKVSEVDDDEKVASDDEIEHDDDDDNDAIQHDSNLDGGSLSKCIEDYEEGNYSPRKYEKNRLELGVVFVDYEKEYELLCHQRNEVCNASTLDEAKWVTMTCEERAFIDVASKGMDNQEESLFSCEATVNNRSSTYAWADKYHPRKPRYFNRVHTGFEWNKYNQTHYDIDNPPPKVVQGYKFNIFYPDLIDKSKAPTFSITPCVDDKDFCVIRFSAGPPYEDLAFKIVNREWNNSHKSGYRCQFINNILQLWFQFKRYRYRR